MYPNNQTVEQGIQGLGWFLRRSNDPIRLAAFYERGLGLPRLRSWDTPESTGVMLWTGHGAVLETNRLSAGSAVEHSSSQCIPVFRTHDLASVERHLAATGTSPVEEESDLDAVTRLFADPDGHLFGVEQPADSAALPARHPREAVLPGGISLGGLTAGLSRIIHRTTDAETEVAFINGLGLQSLRPSGSPDTAARLHLGGSCILDVRAGGESLPPIRERSSMPDAWILRVYGMDCMRDRLGALDTHTLSRHEFAGGSLDYALTPTHRLIGWQERKPYDPDVATTQLIEDLNARDLWCLEHEIDG